MAGQVGHAHPGRDQEAGVVGQSRAMPMTLFLVPPDEGVAGLTMPGGRAEEHGRHGPPGPGAGQVAEVFADAVAKSQVVMALKQGPEEGVLA